MSTIIKLALKEISANLRFSLFFIFNLSLGLTGLLTVETLKTSTTNALEFRSKSILAADLSVGARRKLTDQEVSIIKSALPTEAEISFVTETFTMIASRDKTRLVELRAIESNYPFYGEIKTKKFGTVDGKSVKDLFAEDNIWMYPELLIQLGIKAGESVKIGKLLFKVSDEVLLDSAGVGSGFSFAPPIYISQQSLAKTGLITFGSTGFHSILIKLPAIVSADAIAAQLNKLLTDPAIQVTTSKNSSEQVGRLLGYLSDYLGLSSQIALFLMAIGQIFLYRSFLIKKLVQIATLKSIGMDQAHIFILSVLHISILSVLALIPALAAVIIILPWLEAPVFNLTGIEVKLQLSPFVIFLITCASLISTFFICLPILKQSLQVQAKSLFSHYEDTSRSINSHIQYIYFTPLIVSYYLFGVWLSKSWKVGTAFFVLFLGSILILLALEALLLKIAKPIKTSNLPLRLSLRSLLRARLSSRAMFLTIGMGVLLSNLIPTLEAGIKSEITTPKGLEQPALFLFDIQDDQHQDVINLLKVSNVGVMQDSPMIRARLSTVNGVPFEKRSRFAEGATREEETENRFRNRGFNITYRSKITPAERIIKGDDFSTPNPRPELPRISLEARFADRLNLKIDDLLTFDIQGVEVSGRVANIRKVRWTSFQPNFFIQFEDGYLEDAPKTFLLTTHALAPEKKIELQNKIVEAHPNVSIIDVSRVVDRITGIISQMSVALKVMALFSMFVGLVILFTITSQKAQERQNEINLLKILGFSFGSIRLLFLTEFLLITTLSAITGTTISFGVSYLLSELIFDSSFDFNIQMTSTIFASVVALSIVIILTAVERVLQSSPKSLLSS